MSLGQGSMRVAEKLHAACDECRTRKLRCSGDTPRCVRCKRERIECIYSPQKQMGRPRKRRREDETEKQASRLVQGQDECTDAFSSLPATTSYPGFDSLISPPSLQDTYSPNESLGQEAMTPGHFDFSLPSQFDISPARDFASNAEPAIDPSLWELQPNPSSNNINESSPSLQDAAVTSFDFPQIVVPLRSAMSALADIINCPQCPHEPFNAIQNVQSIVSLMKAIVERFNKVLIEVDREAARLEEAGQKKPFRFADSNPALSHLHTGTPDCPMGFNIELEAREWRRLVKAALRTEVYGNGSNPHPLLDLVRKSEMRQHRWHSDRQYWTEEMVQLHGGKEKCSDSQGCEALGAQHIRRTIDNLKWD